MRTAKAIGLGLVIGITAMFAVGIANVAMSTPTEPNIAGALESLAFFGGFALGAWLALRGTEAKPKPPNITVPPEEWGRRE